MKSLLLINHYSSLQCHVILQKSLQYADLVLKKHFLFILKLKRVVQHNICFQASSINRKFHSLFVIQIFCCIINVFTVTFNQFDVAVLVE